MAHLKIMRNSSVNYIIIMLETGVNMLKYALLY